MVEFGRRLKTARTAKHLNQLEIAEIIGRSLNTVGLYERGLRQPSLETLCLLTLWKFPAIICSIGRKIIGHQDDKTE